MGSYQTKYDKAAECLAKDCDALLTFYDFPAEHWKHLRTTNTEFDVTLAAPQGLTGHVRAVRLRAEEALPNRTRPRLFAMVATIPS